MVTKIQKQPRHWIEIGEADSRVLPLGLKCQFINPPMNYSPAGCFFTLLKYFPFYRAKKYVVFLFPRLLSYPGLCSFLTSVSLSLFKALSYFHLSFMRPVWFSLAFFKMCVYVHVCAHACEQASIFMCQSEKKERCN